MKYLFTFFFLSVGVLVYCQDIHLNAGKARSLLDVVKEIEQGAPDYTFGYSPKMLQKYTVRVLLDSSLGIKDQLELVLRDVPLTFQLDQKEVLIYKRKSHQLTIKALDSKNLEPIPYPYVFVGGKAVQGDVEGRVSMSAYEGEHLLEVRALGYDLYRDTLHLQKSIVLHYQLKSNTMLEEVIITDTKQDEENADYIHLGADRLRHLSLNTPSLGGVNDIMHTVRSLPGVQSGSGGIGGHYVRGSSNGENMILLDDMPVFYPYHLLGMVSIFDGSYIKDLQVYKSGFDPKYGGRASSVVDIHTRNGNKKRWEGEATGSLQAANILLTGPLIKEKSSALVYARASSLNTSFKDVIDRNMPFVERPRIHFYDLYAKYNHIISDKVGLSIGHYNGTDQISDEARPSPFFENSVSSDFSWGNQLTYAQLGVQLYPHVYWKSTGGISTYKNTFQEYDIEDDRFRYFNLSYDNAVTTIKSSLLYTYDNASQVEVGCSLEKSRFNPSIILATEDDFDQEIQEEDLKELEKAVDLRASTIRLYATHRYQRQKWNATYGIHVSRYMSPSATHIKWEPRGVLTYQHSTYARSSLSISKMVQQNHLVSPSAISFPHDIWYPSHAGLQPQEVWHINLAHRYMLPSAVTWEANMYYKTGTNFLLYSSLDDILSGNKNVLQVRGKSIGVELRVSKKIGRLVGEVNYGLSKSERYHDTYNKGKAYRFQFDRRHELKSLLTYSLSKGLTLGTSFYIGSGHPKVVVNNIDLADGISQIDTQLDGNKNSSIGYANVRLDLSCRYVLQSKNLSHSLKLNVYNVFDTQNPLYFELFDDQEIGSFAIPMVASFQYAIQF